MCPDWLAFLFFFLLISTFNDYRFDAGMHRILFPGVLVVISIFIFPTGPNRPSLNRNANAGPTSVTISWGSPGRTKTPVLGYKVG